MNRLPRVSVVLLLLSLALSATAREPAGNVVLVHGAWADGSSWGPVIPLLQEAGLNVVSVQNPLSSLEADVAATRRALEAVDGPTVLVGHSYAGSVISEAGTDPRVVGLVYVAARAPDAGEDFAALTTRFPTMPVRAGVVTRDGMSTLSQDAFLAHFANGLPLAQARQLHAVQQPIAADLFSHRTTSAAWRSKPSWYAVSADDQTTSPALQRYLAQRMGATVLEVDAGHLSPLSHPQEIASLILSAAQGVGPAPDSVHPAHR